MSNHADEIEAAGNEHALRAYRLGKLAGQLKDVHSIAQSATEGILRLIRTAPQLTQPNIETQLELLFQLFSDAAGAAHEALVLAKRLRPPKTDTQG